MLSKTEVGVAGLLESSGPLGELPRLLLVMAEQRDLRQWQREWLATTGEGDASSHLTYAPPHHFLRGLLSIYKVVAVPSRDNNKSFLSFKVEPPTISQSVLNRNLLIPVSGGLKTQFQSGLPIKFMVRIRPLTFLNNK